jgi:hypothetical protein
MVTLIEVTQDGDIAWGVALWVSAVKPRLSFFIFHF